MRVREGRIPFLERHLARLERSLRELGLPRPTRDVAALVRPFAGADEAVLRVEVVEQVAQGRYPRQAIEGKSLFLTNAVRGIVPLASLDGRLVTPDARTAELVRRFWPEG